MAKRTYASHSSGGLTADGGRVGGRKAGGFSLRESLIKQGVTSTTAMRQHLAVVYGSLCVNPSLDITRYRVNANNPNALNMG